MTHFDIILNLSGTPGPPVQCCVGAMAWTIWKIEKSTLLGVGMREMFSKKILKNRIYY